MELGRDFSAAAAAPDEKDFLIPPWTPVTPAKPLPIKLQPTSGHILRRTNWHEPTVAADTSTETSYQARFLPHQNALQKEPPCNDREAHFIDSMAITVDQMRNFRNWDASVAARNQISGHGPATDEPSMGITIDQMRNLRNWDATVAARNQISGDSPAAQEPPMGITMDQMRNLQNWDASVGARNQISGHSPAAQEPSMGITIDQMRNLRNWDAPVAARNQISGNSPAAQEPSMGITMDQMRNLRNWDASVVARNQISGTQEPSMGITIDQMRNLRNWDASVASRNQISGNSPAAQEPSMGITVDQMRNLRNCDASAPVRNPISGHSPAAHEPSMGITMNQMRNLRNWDASVVGRNQISGNSPAAQVPSMGITVDQMRNWDASVVARNQISGNSPAVQDPLMGITVDQMRNLKNWDTFVAARNPISGHSPAANEPALRNPTLGLNKLPPHRDVLAFTDASSATANSSLPQTNDAIHQSNTTSSPHLQIHGARQQSNSPYLWLMNQNFLTHGPNQWMNNGCPPSQIPQLPPQSDGFPVPYYATYGVNSSPRKTIANVVTNGNISFQLAPITPDRAMRASQQSNQPTETVNSSADERVAQEEKQNDTTVATPPRKEPNELYCHQGLSSTLYSSPLMENHKPDNCQENGIDLNKTPQQKPKRKKIRPKVVIEGKPKRTPKPVTPRQSSTKENPSGKRKYVRKNGPKASAKPSTENGESTDLSPGAAGVKSCRRALNFNLEYQAMNNSSETNSTRQLGQGIPFDLNQSLTPVLEDYILLPANPPHCPQQEKKDLQENMEAAVRKTILETKGTYVNGRDNGHPPMHPYTHSEDRDRVIISTIKPSENHLSSPPSKSQNGPQLIDSNSNLHTLLADNKHMKPGSKREYSHTIENPHLHTANLIGNHFYSIPPCNKMIQYNEINRNNSNCSTHIPEIYKKKRIENGNAVLTCNPSGPMIGPEAASNKKTVDANPSASEAGTTIRNMYGHSIPGELLASELAKIFSSTHAQQGRNIRRQHTPVRMLSFGHIERESIEKSNISIRGPDLSSSFSAVQCNQLPRTPPKQAPPTDQSKQKSVVHQGAQGSIEVLHSDPQPKKKENKYTVQGPVHLVATMSHTNTNQVRLQERDAATYDNRSFLHSRGFRSQQIVTYRDPVDEIAQRLKRLSINGGNTNIKGQAKTALVPYGRDNKMVPYEGPFDPTKKSRPRPKVDLDSETIRVWKLLMGIEGSDGVKGIDKEKEKRWEEERKIFRGRADSFIARMHLLQGDRRFSQWKGSVVDSVVGVFLTQNVSDHSSSSAFMSLASRFPLRSTSNNGASKPEGTSISAKEQDVSTIDLDDTTKWHSKISSQRVCDRSSMILHEAEHTKEREMTNSNESFGSIVEGNTTDYAKGKHLVTCESGLEMCQESPENRTSTPISVAESVSLGEAEDRRALEDVISSQNSAVSSQNSVDSTVHMASQIGSSSESNSEVEDTITGYKPNGFNGSASFMELLQMTGTSALEEFYINENGSISPEENPKCASNQLENTQFEKRKSNFGKLDSLKGSGPSTSPSDYHLHHLQNEFNNMQGKPSSSFNFTTPESQDRELEFVKVLGEESKASLPSTASEITDTEDVYCMSSRIGPRTETSSKGKIKQKPLSNAQIALAEDSYTSTSKNPPCSGPEASHNHLFREWNKNPIGNEDAIVSTELQVEHAVDYQQKMNEADFRSQNSEVAEPRNLVEALAQRRNNRMQQPHPNFPNYSGETSDIAECTNVVDKHKSTERKVGESNSREKISCFETASIKTNSNILKEKKGTGEADKKKPFDWDSLRKQARRNVATRERSNDAMDSVDWEAVRCADVDDIADSIKERGMNNMLGERIKDFLNRIVREHGSIDLEWLRDIPPDKAKDYLLSIRGLGLKSVECVRLLTLHQLAFPVDTNVGRICVRLGWVPIQPLPESLHIHLLELYPLLETIQKYLWPRLCTLDQRTLYELHYQMITFGKVFCTKSKPNCNACPMRGECKHFASAFASARLALPGPEEKGLVNSTIPTAAGQEHRVVINPMPLPPPEGNLLSQAGSGINKCEPIIEEPATPEPECIENSESDIEDTFYEDPDEIPTIRLNLEELTQNIQNFMQENNMELQDGDMSKALVAITPGAASIPVPKLKNVSRLRTEHLVYELPDSHPLLQGLDQRERDDPCPYLLAIWTPGETVQSTKPPEICCNSQDSGNLCNLKTCFACSSKREENAQKVRGTLLIPCRTAMRGSFPLNGTYFQVNEVFADHASSINPIDVPRAWIWNLPRRTVYFGTSIPTIFRGLTTEGIQYCFWRGFVCVRGFDRTSRAPRPLTARLHFPASMLAKTKKKRAEEAKGK